MMTQTQAESLLLNATPVKSNPVRRVLRTDRFYLKLDRRGSRALGREWKSAQLLAARGIPTVKHLAFFPQISTGEALLVTEAWPKAHNVGEYLYSHFERNNDSFPAWGMQFASFFRLIRACNLFHPDFHVGNILYSESLNRFALVDVLGVRRATIWDQLFYRYRMDRIFFEFRSFLGKAELLELLKEGGILQPENFYKTALRREATALHREWPKRRNQILHGYAKFTVWENNICFCIAPDLRRRESIGEWEKSDGENVLLAHFFLQLAHIPHRPVAAFNRETKSLLWAAEPPSPSLALDWENWRNRLLNNGIQTESSHWGQDQFGRAVLRTLDPVVTFLKGQE